MAPKIVILTQGSRGDVQPYVALGVELQRVGYHVRILAPEILRHLVNEAGLGFIPSKINPQEFIRNPHIQAAARKGGQLNVLVSILRQAVPLLESVFDEYWDVSVEADILISSTIVFGVADCAEKLNIPMVAAPIHPLLVPTQAFPSTFLAPFGVQENNFLNPATHRVVQSAFWGIFRSALNRWRQKMALPHIENYFEWLQARNIPTVYGFSTNVLPVPHDWPPNHHITGYWFLDQSPDWHPEPALTEFLENGESPVYVGFGSMDSQDSVRMTSIAIEALDLCGCRGVFATGWGGLQTDALPNTIFPIREIPHAWLFPRMAALVHHGGMGTTAAGLRAGIPSVILPIGADQFFWANRVQKLQVGLSKNYFKKTTKQLASVITKAMRDPILRENAAVLGEKIRAEQGVEQAVKLIKEYCPI